MLLLWLLLQGPQLPAPAGYVNDFAGVLPPNAEAAVEAISADVRAKSRGEIVAVTMPDLGGLQPYELGTKIGREWQVGARAPIGAPERNTGTIILIIPKESSSDNRGHCWVTTGSGTEGFVTDAMAGDACREATPLFREQRYGDGVVLVAARVAQRYAAEFGFALDTGVAALAPQPVRRRAPSGGGFNPATLFFLFIFVIFLLGRMGGGGRGRRRHGSFPVGLLLGAMLGARHGGRGGAWGGGWSGGGGGFGGFGGGGGFSGGGGGSSW